MLGRVDLAHGNGAAVRITGRRIKHAKLESRAEQAMQSLVDIGFGDQVLMHRIDEGKIRLPFSETALEIGSCLQCSRGGVGHIARVVMAGRSKHPQWQHNR